MDPRSNMREQPDDITLFDIRSFFLNSIDNIALYSVSIASRSTFIFSSIHYQS